MRNSSSRYRSLIVLLAAHLVLVPAAPLGAQTFITPKGEAQNVRFEQRESGIVEIFYDLISSDPRAVFSVVVEGSQDGGSTWGMRPQTMTGDVGAGITPGVGKKIVWDSGKDMERVQFNSLRFRMVATGGPLASNAKPAPATQKPATVTPPADAGGGGGGKKKWIFIGGGVVAAGATAAVVLGSQKASPPSITTSDVAGNTGTLLASISSVVFRVAATNPEGDALTASFNFGDGTNTSVALSNGEAFASKTYTTAGSYSPTVTINGGKGGTATASYATVTVASLTGRWSGVWTTVSGLTASLTLTQSGTNITGDVTVSGSPNFTNPGRVTGSVRAPFNVTMTLTGANGVFYDIDLNGASPFASFTGNAIGATALPWTMTRQ